MNEINYLTSFPEISFDAVITFNRLAQVVDWNPSAEKIFGWTAQEALNQTLPGFLWPASPGTGEDDPAHQQTRLARGELIEQEHKLHRKDGTEIWIQSHKRAIFDQAGGLSGYVGVYRDVTRDKQTEQRLIDLEEKLRQVTEELQMTYDQSPIGMLQLDTNLRYIRINNALAAMNGLPAEDHVGKALREIVPDLAPKIEEAFRKVIETGQPVLDVELKGETTADPGNPHTWLESWFPMRDSQNRIIGLNVFAQDITKRKQAEEALRAKQAELQLVADNTPLILTRCSRDFRYLFVNRAAAALFGLTPEQMIGKSIIEIMGEQNFHIIKPRLEQVLSGQQVEYEAQIHYSGVGLRWVNIVYVPERNEHNEVMGWLASITDITDRKQRDTQSQLLALVAEMVRLISDPNEFLYQVAETIGEYLQVQRSFFIEIDQAHDRGLVLRDYHRNAPSVAGEYRLSDYSAQAGRELDLGQTVINYDSAIDTRTAPYFEKTYEPRGERAYIAVPLMRNGERVAVFWVSTNVPRKWRSEEITLIETVAERAWLAVEKLRLDQEVRRERELLLRIFENIPVMLTRYHPNTRVIHVNPAFEQVTGWSAEEARAIDIMAACYPDPIYRQEVQQFMETLPKGWKDLWMTTRDGRVIQTSWANIRLSDDTQVGIGLDITERKQAEAQIEAQRHRLQVLAEASRALAEAGPGYQPVLETIVLQVSQAIGDVCALRLPTVDGKSLILAAMHHPDPEILSAYRDLTQAPIQHDEGLSGQVFQSGESVLIPVVTQDQIRAATPNRLWPTLDKISLHSVMVVPLIVQNQIIGTLSVGRDISPQSYTEDDLPLLAELAYRAALAVENARIYAVEQNNAQSLRRIAERIARLQRVTAALSEAVTPMEVAAVVVDQGAKAMGAVSGTMLMLAKDGQTMELLYSTSSESVTRAYQRFPVSIRVPATDAVRSREMIWIESRKRYLERYPHLAEQIARWGHEAAVAIPIQEKGRILGALSLSFDHVLRYTDEDRDYALTLTRQGAQALERARLYEAEREYARQQSALYKLADQLHRTNSLGHVFDSALDAILGAVHCDRASILLFNEHGVMQFLAWRGLSDAYRQATEGHSPWKPDSENPEPIYMNDVAVGDLDDALRAVIQNEGIGALAFIPLVTQGKVIGKFMVYFNAPHSFTEAELDLSLTIARQLAFGVERIRTEENLRVSRERYLNLFDLVPVAVYTCDAQGYIHEYNQHAVKLWGREPNTQNLQERFCGSMRLYDADGRVMPRDECPMARALRGEVLEAHELEFIVEQPNGQLKTVIAHPRLLLNERGEIAGAINCLYDITDRKEVEEALRQSEARFSLFMQYLPGLAWLKDLEGRYMYANAAAEKAFGTASQDLYGKTDEEIFPADTAAQFRKHDLQALAAKTGVQVVETLRQDDGVLHYSLVSKFPIPGPDGTPALIGGTAFDITERKQAEEAVLESEKRLKTLNETLEQKVREQTAEVRKLASDLTIAEQRERRRIAHILHDDLQQRLYAIQMQMSFLRTGFDEKNTAVQWDLAEIRSQMDEVVAVTRHLSVNLSPPILNDEGLPHAISWLAAHMHEQYGLKVNLQTNEAFAVPDKDTQILLFDCVRELLFNIVKHANVNQATVILYPTRELVCIEVSDQGKGFDQNALNRPQADALERPQLSFGLPTLRHRLNLYGGKMDIRSRLGEGTQITLTLPIKETPEEQNLDEETS